MSPAILLASLFVLIAVAAEAQAVNPPQRVTRPTRAPGTTRSLQLDTSLFGGYDRNLVSGVLTTDGTASPSTYRGWGSAALKYAWINDRRSLDFGAGATANTVNNQLSTAGSGPSGPVYGTNANLDFQTPLGSATTFTLSNTAARTPYYQQGLFGATPPGAYSPDGNPVNGIVDGHVWFINSSASVGGSLSRRTNTSVSYSYQRSLYEGGRRDSSNQNHSAVVSMDQKISRSNQLQGSYHVASRGAVQAGLHYDGLAHGVTFGFRRAQPIGPTRTLAISVGGGAELIDSSSSNRYWQPTYNASVDTDISRTWVVSAQYRQTSMMLYSPLSAPDSYLAQTALISVGGNLSRNVDLTVNTGAARGEVAASNSVTGSPGHYLALNTSVQLRADLSAGLSVVVSTNYYRSDLSGAATQFLLTPENFQRSSVRAGFTWTVPLLNSGPSTRRPRGRTRS